VRIVGVVVPTMDEQLGRLVRIDPDGVHFDDRPYTVYREGEGWGNDAILGSAGLRRDGEGRVVADIDLIDDTVADVVLHGFFTLKAAPGETQVRTLTADVIVDQSGSLG
jgi:hypothetical protein